MPTRLYGTLQDRRTIARKGGSLAQFAGVKLYTLGDGVERGVRCLEFRTGSGLIFQVLVDRAFDIGACEYRGAAIGWQSPTGFRHPGLHEHNDEGGLSWMRSFSGLLVTCGLDHALMTNSDSAEHYHYPNRKTVNSSIHGRIANIPGRLCGYGERWEGDQCVLWCEGLVQQSTVFGEDLHLLRRIEAPLGGSGFTIHDRVVNHGFYRTPHMLLYHINVGYPVLDEGSRYLAPVKNTLWASHADALQAQQVGYRTQPAPRDNFLEQVFEHEMCADEAGKIPVALVNPNFNDGRSQAQGLGLLVEVNQSEFPCHFQWQNYQSGHYVMGIEPCTNHVLGKPFAKERNELIWLEHGEERNYTTRFEVLDGELEIDAARQCIEGICRQPQIDYPVVTGEWPPIRR
ncbi:MAG: aldose 1-epimerase family protein [Propionivibrio sp.]